MSSLIWVCVLTFLSFVSCGPIDPVSYQHPVESHHSLTPPLDKSQVYWNFGGSTVVTKKQIRLTPAAQDKRGWLWNEYPLESTNWEIEFKVEIFSKPHFGGDGFGLWVLGSDQDPSFTKDPEALTGPLFGMRNTFQGFGIMFDIYDNDNRRNNPSIFVLENQKPGVFKYNHDNDFEDDMVTAKPDKVIGHGDQDPSRTYSAHKCVADFRNTGKPTRVLVKFLNQILHVYIDTQEGMGWKFCLAVKLQDKYPNHHLAFSAATGQVADNHDILDITTRYLADTDKEFDDSTLAQLDDRSHSPSRTWNSLFWFIITATGLGLTGFTAYEYRTFKLLVHDHIDSVRVCQRLNQYVLPHYAIHAALTFFLFVTGTWGCFLFQLPLVLWRAYEFYSKTYLFSPSQIGGAKGHTSGMSTALATRLVGPLIFYGLAQLYYFYHLFF